MTFRFLAVLLLALLSTGGILPPAVRADAPRYKFQPGQTLRYQVTFDSRAQNLAASTDLTGEGAAPGRQVTEFVTARVKAMRGDGTAVLEVTCEPWRNSDLPGPQTCTLRLAPDGRRLPREPGDAPAPSVSATLPFPVLLPARPLANPALVEMEQTTPNVVTRQQTRGHDGLLVDMTQRRQSQRIVFDVRAGNVLKQAGTTWITRTLKMTARGKRGSDDFGRVAPVTRLVLSTTVQRLADKPPPTGAELHANAP